MAPGTIDLRMQDRLEPAKCWRIAEYPRAQCFAVDSALLIGDTGKCFKHSRDRAAARCHQLMYLTIGIEDRNQQPAQHHCRSAFPHADRAGQADLFHAASTA